MKTKKIKIIFWLFIGCIISCNEDDPETNTSNFDVKELLEDVSTNNIVVAVNEFRIESEILNASIEAYLGDSTEQNLIAARDQWKTIALTYASIYAFNIGEVRARFFHQALYNWPTLPNAIESFISDNSTIDKI